METSPFGTTPDGRHVRLFTIRNAKGLVLQLSEYGAAVISLKVPDREGKVEEVTLAHRAFEASLDNPDFFGVTVGRFGNRIAGGEFTLDGKKYELATNNEPGGLPSHVHGGVKGFDKKVWKGQPVIRPNASGVCFTCFSDEMEEGYPGTLTTHVTYWLTEENELVFEVTATTDAPTPVNIINHCYWNLSGDLEKDILTHELRLEADAFLPTDRGLIPTGERAPVTGTPMDFTRSTSIGERIEADFEPLQFAGGYDHCWVVRNFDGEELQPVAALRDPGSGRVMEVLSDQPGVQFYAGNFLPKERTGLCLETEAFPNSPNQKGFPNCILKPGETYKHKTVFRFSVRG